MITQTITKELKDYIDSKEFFLAVDEINKNAEIYDEGAISKIIFDMFRGIFPARELINEISDRFSWDKEFSMSIANEIKTQVFEPVKYEMERSGFNLDDIEIINPTPLKDLSIEALLKKVGVEPELKKSDENKKTKSISTKDSENKDVLSSIEKTGEETNIKFEGEKDDESKGVKTTSKEDPKPFVLHQESSGDVFNEIEENKPSSQRKSFGFSLGKFFSSSDTNKKKEVPTAKIEGPNKIEEKDKKKTVHYSEHRTKLQGDGSGFINLSKVNTPSTNTTKKQEKTQENKSASSSSPKTTSKQSKEPDKKTVPASSSPKTTNEKSKASGIKEGIFTKTSNKTKQNDKEDNSPETKGNTINLR
ncbi:MAG: hypothetical protein WDZ80_04910 [Candidatus Paceibacterota bacterium]